MKTVILLTLLLAFAGSAKADSLPWGVRVIHDDARGVTCWHYVGVNQGGISCLPDAQIHRQQARAADDDQPTPATTPAPHSHEERFQL
ncbi:hypothetical protein [Pseudomonas fluorescens]|uniref:Uncharacterized protein n=1 Tax=Pseudomonas fluorescens TaxID=294 RepID=A0A5E7EV42_PSEFL|nr:hypothetical protein [Pseudomonas fluorescens]VVO30820.1 hypothetical protein PS723_04976 [Pseudomonas fluorescens]